MKYFKGVFLLLLLVLPSQLCAQTLSRCEYWFDDDFANRKNISISGTDAEFSRSIDTESLDVGLHRFNIRVRQSDGKYSGVSTSTFQKVASGEVKWLEYWFDGDRDNVKRMAGKEGYDGDGYKFVDEADISGLDVGMHNMFFRGVSDNGLVVTAVSVAPFQKYTSGVIKWLEYWIDGDIENSQKLDAVAANGGKEYRIVTDIDFSTLPVGQHRLSMRAVNEDGLVATAVTTTPFIKQGSGEVQWLEYWIDGDKAHSKKVKGSPASDGNGYTFVKNLDLSTVSPGHHRFYFRSMGANASLSTSVTSAPIIVKSRYDNPEGVTVDSYSFTVDDKEPIERPVVNKKDIVNIPFSLRTQGLSMGEHTLKAKFTNSLGLSTSFEQAFTVVPPDNPSINLECWSYNTYVWVKYNSIPNDKQYEIIERGSDGVERVIGSWTANRWITTLYPDIIENYCYPKAEGVATYYIKARYVDRNGFEDFVTSNEVTINNISPSNEDIYGGIVGQVKFNDNNNNSLLSPHKRLKVKFSDNGEEVSVQPNGTFHRDNIPLGTTVTMSIDDDDYYTYESLTVVVDKKTRNNLLIINATVHDDVAVSVDNEDYDLTANNFTIDGRVFDMDVKNLTDDVWTGIVDVIAIKKKDFRGNIEDLFNSARPYYNVGYSYIENLQRNNYKHITIEVGALPIGKNDEEFIFFFMTQKDDQSNTKQYKQLVFESSYIHNPMALFMSPDPEIDDVEYPSLNDFIYGIYKIMKELDTWQGPFCKAIKKINDKWEKFMEDGDLEQFESFIPEIFIIFNKDIKNIYKDLSKDTKSVREFYGRIKDISDMHHNKPFDNFLLVCKNIFKDFGKYGPLKDNPFAQIYLLYLDAAEEAVNKINAYQSTWTDIQLGDIFSNDNITFKIEAIRNYGWFNLYSESVSGAEIVERIDDIQIFLENTKDQQLVASYTARVNEENSNEVVLRRERLLPSTYDIGYPSNRFWMEITWNSGRVSRFPLYDNYTKWDRNGQDVNAITLKLKTTTYPLDHKIEIIEYYE